MKRPKFGTPEERLVYELFNGSSYNEEFVTALSNLTKEQQDKLSDVVSDLLTQLSEYDARYCQIVRLRVGMEGKPFTYEEIGKRFGVTRERVRQLLLGAYRFLRKPVRLPFLNEFVPVSHRVEPQRVPSPEKILDLPFAEITHELDRRKQSIIEKLVFRAHGPNITIREFLEKYSARTLWHQRGMGNRTFQALKKVLSDCDLSLREN